MFYKIITEVKGEHSWDKKKLNVPEVTHDIPESYVVNVDDLRISKIEIGSWMTHTYKVISKEKFEEIIDKIIWPSEINSSDRYKGAILIRTKKFGDILTYINIKTNKDNKEYYCLTSSFDLYDNDWYSKCTLPKRNIKIFTTREEYENDKNEKTKKSQEKVLNEKEKQNSIKSKIPSFEFKTPKFKIVKIIKETEKTSAKVGDTIQGVICVIDENKTPRLKGVGTTTNWVKVQVNGKEDKYISPLTFQDLFLKNYVVEKV